MKPAELERLLALADEVESLERRMHRAETLVAEVARDEDVVSAAPRIGEAMTRAGSALEPIARELEREWVDQGPLVTAWQRAVELEQVAEAAGADPGPCAEDVEAARLRVESARLATRRQRELIDRERQAMAEAVEASPFDVEHPAGRRRCPARGRPPRGTGAGRSRDRGGPRHCAGRICGGGAGRRGAGRARAAG